MKKCLLYAKTKNHIQNCVKFGTFYYCTGLLWLLSQDIIYHKMLLFQLFHNSPMNMGEVYGVNIPLTKLVQCLLTKGNIYPLKPTNITALLLNNRKLKFLCFYRNLKSVEEFQIYHRDKEWVFSGNEIKLILYSNHLVVFLKGWYSILNKLITRI